MVIPRCLVPLLCVAVSVWAAPASSTTRSSTIESAIIKTAVSQSAKLVFKVVRPSERVLLSHPNCRNDSQWSVSATAQVVKPFFVASPHNAHRYVCYNGHNSGILRLVYMEQPLSLHTHNTSITAHGSFLHVHCSVTFRMRFHLGLVFLRLYHGLHLCLQTSARTETRNDTTLRLDGHVEMDFHQGSLVSCVWSMQDFAEYLPVEHSIRVTREVQITMPATNVRVSSVEGKVGGMLLCFYDGFPEAHSVVWEVIKSQHEREFDSYYGRRENSRFDGGGFEVERSEDEDSVDGRRYVEGRVFGLFESGEVVVRCSVNNTYDTFKGAVAEWTGKLTVQPLDVHALKSPWKGIKAVRVGGILELSLPQCPGDAVVWTDGWKRVRRRIRMVGDLKASKTYVAIDDNRLCGRLNVVVIEKELHLKHPGKELFSVDEVLVLFCSLSGWFDSRLTLSNNLTFFVNGIQQASQATTRISNGLTTLSTKINMTDSFLGSNEVVCVWRFEDVARSVVVEKVPAAFHIWMPIKWVWPNATTANENSSISCLHLSYPEAQCVWKDKEGFLNSSLHLTEVGQQQQQCSCSNKYHGRSSSITWSGTISVVPRDSVVQTSVLNNKLSYVVSNRCSNESSYRASKAFYALLCLLTLLILGTPSTTLLCHE